MQQIIEQIAAKHGLAPDVAQNALGAIMGFLVKEAPDGLGDTLLEKVPGAKELLAGQESGGGGLMGMVGGMFGGGGLMGLGAKLMGMGLSMDQIKGVSKDLFHHGKEHAGEDTMGQIIGNIPGLSSYL